MARPGFSDRERIEAVVKEALASGMLRWPVAGARPSTKSAEHVGADIPLEHCHPASAACSPVENWPHYLGMALGRSPPSLSVPNPGHLRASPLNGARRRGPSSL